MRKRNDALRDTLLDLARSIADTEGIDAVNIRVIAGMAGVATGTVYNYFSDKNEILLALTEDYWRQALAEMKAVIGDGSFCMQLQQIFSFLKEKMDASAGKLMSSLGGAEEGQARMASMQSMLASDLAKRMEADADIRKDIWDDTFTKEEFARFIVIHIMALLRMRSPDADFFIAVIKRIIY